MARTAGIRLCLSPSVFVPVSACPSVRARLRLSLSVPVRLRPRPSPSPSVSVPVSIRWLAGRVWLHRWGVHGWVGESIGDHQCHVG